MAQEPPIATAWTNDGTQDPEHRCDVAQPWCVLPYGHDGFCTPNPHQGDPMTTPPEPQHVTDATAAIRRMPTGGTSNQKPAEQLQAFVVASLEFDYTQEVEGVGYDTDDAEQAAALANITEMHRLINVGHERLFDAHERIDELQAENARLRARAELASEDSDRIARGGAHVEEQLRAELDEVRHSLGWASRERDDARARAHELDTRRPTQWAYDQACRVLREHKARIDKALELHREFKIYDECGHKHEFNSDGSLPEGVLNVSEIGLVCADGYLHSICRECCTGGSQEYQTEACASDHLHEGAAACWPCPTAAALSAPAPSHPTPEKP